MTPEEIIGAFDSAQVLLHEVRCALRDSNARQENLVVEARTRLEQSALLLRRFRGLEQEHDEKEARLFKVRTPEERRALAPRIHEIGSEIRVIGEAFYYFAFRARQALRHKDGLNLKCETAAVRDVRNRLIEHSDKGDGVMVSWWMSDCPEGLVLQPDGKGLDKGLYPNAEEFISEVTTHLQHVVNERDKDASHETPKRRPSKTMRFPTIRGKGPR